MMLRRTRMLAVLALGLGGCQTAPPPLNNPPPLGISVRIENGNRAEREAAANRYCQQAGKRAASVDSVKSGPSSDIVNLTCE